MTIRGMITEPVFDLLEYYTKMCSETGEDTEYLGIKLFDEPEKFVKGQYFNACAHLVCHYGRTNDTRYGEAVTRLHKALAILQNDILKTWGKTSLLHGMCLLKRNGRLGIITEQELELIEKLTRYDDFLDRETVTLKGAPTNYYQVAMACAGMRELLGFESDGCCDKIKEKLFSIMNGFSDTGWMDERPPYGRFDRYSMMICAELSDTLYYIDRETPEFAKKNLLSAASLALACANPNGDGVIYGRSLSIHGDCAFLEIISTALRLGLIDKKDIPYALNYSRAILQKSFDFWYNKDKKTFDIWFNGRTTNKYRQVRRLLEVNLDMCNHMLTTLENFEAAGLADTEITDAPYSPHSFGNPYKAEFVNEEGKYRALYSFVQNGKLIQLPLINFGGTPYWTAYLPFPAAVGELEAPPEGFIPWLTPEFTDKDGKKYIPAGDYDAPVEKSENGMTFINIEGFMTELSDKPNKSEIPFTAAYLFTPDKISITYLCEHNFDTYRVVYGKPNGAGCKVSVNGNAREYEVQNDPDYFTPHGPCVTATEWTDKGNYVKIEITGLTD